MGANGKCIASNPFCNQFDGANCVSCYNGWELQGNNCVTKTVPVSTGSTAPTVPAGSNSWTVIDTLCSEWKDGKCSKCSTRAYMGIDGRCVAASSVCNEFNGPNCVSCYNGWELKANTCVIKESPAATNSNGWTAPSGSTGSTAPTVPAGSNSWTVIDTLCSEWKDGKCSKCSTRAYMGANGKCIASNPLCNEFNGPSCVSCYVGWELQGTNCVTKAVPAPPAGFSSANSWSAPTGSNGWTVIDTLCSEWKDGKCNKCSTRSYLGGDGRCVAANPACNQFEGRNCVTCYPGFELEGNNCVSKVQAPVVASNWSGKPRMIPDCV